MIFLIPIAFGIIAVNCYLAFFKNLDYSVRRSFLTALTALFFFVAATTELLSIFNWINRWGISLTWFMLDISLLLWHFRLSKREKVNFKQVFQIWYNSAAAYFKQLGFLTFLILSTLLTITLAVGLIATPNNIDSLSYHLSRLGYWIQNGNIEHYASNIERAISFTPLSEYVHLHTFLLSGSERLFQIVQWLSFVGILGFISILVETFSGSKPALRIALCFGATIPIVLLESMTTQNDLVVTFFIIATAAYVFDYVKQNNPLSLALLPFAVALGVMAKGTFVFYTLPFGLYFLIHLLLKKQWKILGRLFAGVLFLAFLLNAPFLYRTYKIFNSPFGTVSNGNQNYINNIQGLASSTSKHIFLHLGFVSPGDRYNQTLKQGLDNFHDWLGIPLNNSDGMTFKMNKLNFNEDFAHNFLAMWVILISFLILPFTRLSSQARWYLTLSVASFLVFCFFISYQTYGSRIHIPFFILISPAIGLIYSAITSSILQVIFITVLWLNAIPFTILSVTHPLLSTKWFFEKAFPIINKPLKLNIQPDKLVNLKQESILFSSPEKIIWGDHWDEIKSLVNYVDSLKAKNIGFDFEEPTYDYGYQYVLRNPERRFEHVLVRNASKILEDPNFTPEVIVAEHDEGDSIAYHGITYYRKWSGTFRYIYVPLKTQN